MNKTLWYLKHLNVWASAIDSRFFDGKISRNALPKRCQCNVCNRKFHNYRVHGNHSELSLEYETLGMGRRISDCPYCGAPDKHRILLWVLKNKTRILNSKCSVLHFAPEHTIRNELIKNVEMNYVSGDLEPGRADRVVDMTCMPFDDNSFDYVIASMVLEHISDENKGLQEIYRVLKPNGVAVLTVPIVKGRKCFEDASIVSASDRLRLFGQEDHVRLYGDDLKAHFSNLWTGSVKIERIEEDLSRRELKRLGAEGKLPVILLGKFKTSN